MKYGKGWHNQPTRHSLASKGIRTTSKGIKRMPNISDKKMNLAFDTFYEDLTLSQRKSINDIILKPYFREDVDDVLVQGGKFDPETNTITIRGVEEFSDYKLKELMRHEAGHNTFMRFMVGVHKNPEKYSDLLQEFMDVVREEGGTYEHSWQYYFEYLGDEPYKYMYLRRALNEDLANYYRVKGTPMEDRFREQNPKTFEVMDKIHDLEQDGELDFSVRNFKEVPFIPRGLE